MTEAAETPSLQDAVAEAVAEADQAVGGETIDATPSPEGEAPSTETPNTIKVVIGGQEQEVSLEEAAQGYQRQADYTRKTQELAAERQRLERAEIVWQMLEDNPAEAIARLSDHFEVGNQQYSDEELDPLERDVRELKSFAEQQQEAEFQREVENEIARIRDAYGDPELDPEALLSHAVERNIGSLDAAYRDMKFQSLYDERAKAREAERVAQDAAAEEAKRAAAIVEGGSDRSGKGTALAGGDKPKTIAEAWAAAEAELMA